LVPDFQVEALVEVAQQFLWHGGEICAADDGYCSRRVVVGFRCRRGQR
jgi:hypothetical protein